MSRKNRTLHLPRTERQETHAELRDELDEAELLPIPSDWVKGQLLNVRNAGHAYRVTVLGEEYDHRNPARCLEFTNSAECQNFVSAWYARQSTDPRAG